VDALGRKASVEVDEEEQKRRQLEYLRTKKKTD
jgi:hypothetical protein